MLKYATMLCRHGWFVLLFLITALIGGVSVPAAHAQDDDDRSVEVERRDGTITILVNGNVEMVETWVTNFLGGPFRFAFREIPLNRVEDITGWG